MYSQTHTHNTLNSCSNTDFSYWEACPKTTSPFVTKADSNKGHGCANSKVCSIFATQHKEVSQIIADS